MKITQICNAPNGIAALLEDGTIRYGFWCNDTPNDIPKFIWRKIPSPKGGEYEFMAMNDQANGKQKTVEIIK